MTRLTAQLCIALLLSGCMQRGIDLPETGQKSWFEGYSIHNLFAAPLRASYNKHTNEKTAGSGDENLTDSDSAAHLFQSEDKNKPLPKKDQNLPRTDKHKRGETQRYAMLKEFPKTIRNIPVVGEIPKIIPSAKEIPVINQISHYFSKSSGRSAQRLRRHTSLSASGINRRTTKDMDHKSTKNEYAQYFSGGLHYDEKIFLKKIKVLTDKEQHTIVKFLCTNISPYTVKYDPGKKRIVIMLNECTAKPANIKVISPKLSILKESSIEYLPQGIMVTLQLKQDAKIDVLESYGPTYISIDITPMYRLYIGEPS